jgi:nitrite reductase (NO-forming)
VKPRATTALYQTAARAWLTLAACSLVLSPARRVGLWLPLHLTLAGAIATAIAGAMQTFMHTLTATPTPPTWVVRTQFGLLTFGVLLIAVGMSSGTPWAVALGGSSFTASVVILAWMLQRAWRRSLTRRHALPIAAYGLALAALIIGAIFGALLGSRAVGGETYLELRRAHMTLNVLGFASLTVVGTLVTLLPTVLRVRMVPWRGMAVLTCLAAGLILQAGGSLARVPSVLAAGGILCAAGALGVAGMVVTIARTERAWAVPTAGVHMMAAVAWFTVGSVWLAISLVHGRDAFDRFLDVFLVSFVLGWLVQVLLGAWSYLLPMATPGHPQQHRRMLASFEFGGRTQVAALNAGLILLAARGAGHVGPGVANIGLVLVFAGGGMALMKAWLYPVLARAPVLTDRARVVWGS